MISEEIREKRIFPRVFNPCLVFILNDSGEDGPNTTAVLHDISGSGLSFLCQKPYRAGEKLEIEIKLPSRSFEGPMRVVRCDDSGGGIFTIAGYFEGLASDGQKDLLQLLRH